MRGLLAGTFGASLILHAVLLALVLRPRVEPSVMEAPQKGVVISLQKQLPDAGPAPAKTDATQEKADKVPGAAQARAKPAPERPPAAPAARPQERAPEAPKPQADAPADQAKGSQEPAAPAAKSLLPEPEEKPSESKADAPDAPLRPSASVDAPRETASVPPTAADHADTQPAPPRDAPSVQKPDAAPVKAADAPLTAVPAPPLAAPQPSVTDHPAPVDVKPPAKNTTVKATTPVKLPFKRMRLAALAQPRQRQQVQRYIEDYDGGDCVFVAPSRVSKAGVAVEGYASSGDALKAFTRIFKEQVGFAPAVSGHTIPASQCPVVDFLRKTKVVDAKAPALDLDRRLLRTGDLLTGTVSNITGPAVTLFWVRENGAVQDMSLFLHDAGPTKVFRIQFPEVDFDEPGGPFLQMFVVVVGPKPVSTGGPETIVEAGTLFPSLDGDAGVRAAARGFLLGR